MAFLRGVTLLTFLAVTLSLSCACVRAKDGEVLSHENGSSDEVEGSVDADEPEPYSTEGKDAFQNDPEDDEDTTPSHENVSPDEAEDSVDNDEPEPYSTEGADEYDEYKPPESSFSDETEDSVVADAPENYSTEGEDASQNDSADDEDTMPSHGNVSPDKTEDSVDAYEAAPRLIEGEDVAKNQGERAFFSNDAQTIITIISLLIAFIALVLSFFLYRGRRIALAKNQHALMPEAWLPTLEKVDDSVHEQSNWLKEIMRRFADSFSANSKKIDDVKDMFGTFRQALDKKDEEIERYKKGYDQKIFIKFLRRFAKLQKQVDEAVRHAEQDPTQVGKDLKNIQSLLSYALEECDVVAFSPKVGADWTKLAKGEVEDNPATIPTRDPKQDQTITEVVSVGYKLDNTEPPVFIVPARVKIYVHNTEKQS